MAAIGGGINLGAATVFLLADGTGLRRDLARSERLLDNYAKKVEATSRAIQKASASKAVSDQANSVVDATKDSTFVDQQKIMSAQVAKTSADIAKAYAIRTKAMADLVKAAQVETSAVKANATAVTNASKAVAAAQAKVLTKSQLTTKLATSGPGGGKLTGAAETAVINANKRAIADLVAAKKNLASVEAAGTAVVKKAASVRLSAAQAIVDANKLQARSTDDLVQKLDGQIATYKRFGQAAGGSYVQMARSVETAARSVVVNVQKMNRANELLVRANNTLAANPTSIAAIKAQEAAYIATQGTLQKYEQSITKLAATQHAIDTKAIRESGLRADAVVADAQREVAARAEESRALKAQQFQGVQQAGQAAGRAFSVGAVAMALATQQAVSFEQKMVAVASISQEVADNLPSFTSRVQDLAVELGKSPTELAEGLFEIAQAGFEGEEAFGLLDISARAAVAGMTSVEDAARPLIGVVNAWQLSTKDAKKAMDVMFSGVQEGVFSFEDLSSQLGDNISTAKALGVSLQELMAVYIVLTKRSNSLSESTTQVNAIMNAFLKPSDALTEAIHDLTGESAQLFFRTHDLADVLAVVNQLLGDNADAAGQLFPNIRSIRGIFGLTNDEAKDFGVQLDTVTKASDGAGAAAEVLAVQETAAAFKLSQAREQLRQVAIILGTIFVPGILSAAEGLAKLAKGFSDLDPGIQSGVGNAILMTTALLGIVLAVTKVAAALKLLIDTGKTLGEVFARARLSLGAMSLAALGIGAAIIVYQNVQEQNAKLEASYKNLADAISNAKSETDKLKLAQIQSTNTPNLILGGLLNLTKETDAQQERIRQVISDANNGKNQEVSAAGFALHVADVQRFNDYLKTAEDYARIQNAIAQGYTNAAEDGAKFIAIATDLQAKNEGGTLEGTRQAELLEKTAALFGENTEINDRRAALILLTQAQERYNDNLEKMSADKAGEKFFQDVQNIDASSIAAISAGLSQNQKDIDAATAALDKETTAMSALATAGDRTEEETADLMKSLAEQARIATGTLDDLSSATAFMQQKFQNANITIPQILLNLQKLGEIKLDVSGGASDLPVEGIAQGTVEIAAAMDTWQSKITEVTDAIAANSEEISKWQGIQSTVTDAIGSEEDGFARLHALLDDGTIKRKEYNDILAAGKQLNDLSVIGIDNERLAQARALVDLAAYESQFHQVTEDYKDLAPEQRGRIEALKKENVQTALLYALFLKMATAMGLVTQAEADMFLGMQAQADPAVSAVLQEFGLIPKTLSVDVNVSHDDAVADLKDIQKELADTDEAIGALTLHGAPVTDQAKAALKALVTKKFGLTEKARTLELIIEADGKPLDDVSAQADKIRTREEEISDEVERQDALAKSEADSVQAIADHVIEVRNAWRDAFAAMQPSAETLQEMANDTIPGILAAIRPGLDDPFAWLTQGIDTASLSFDEFLLKSRQITGVDIDFTDAQRQALSLKVALDDSTEALQDSTDAISAHQQAISEYEGFQTLLDDVLGDASNNLDNWNRKLALGQATQKEFNDAVKSGEAHAAFENLTKLVQKHLLTQEQANQVLTAAESIRHTSTKGILQEQAAIALNLVSLDKYIKEHGTAAAGYANLTDEQRGFITALEDEGTQLALNQALMILQLEAMGAIPEGVAKKFLELEAKVHPALGAILKDIGLLSESTVDVQVQSRLDGKKPSELVKADIPAQGIDVPIRAKEVRPARQAQQDLNLPDLKQATADVQQARTEFNAIFAGMKTDATQDGALIGILFTSTMAGRIRTSATAVATAVTNLRSSFAQGVAVGQAAGMSTADAYVGALVQVLQEPTLVGASVKTGPVGALGTGAGQAQTAGKLAGASFLAGVVLSLRDPNAVKNITTAAKAIGATMFGATMDALDASSPSGKGIEAGDAFTQGIVIGLDKGQSEIENSGQALAQGLTDAAGDLTFGGNVSGELRDISAALIEMSASEETIDFRQLEAFADTLDGMDDPTGRLQRASGAIRGMADSAKTEILNISSAGQDFGSNLEYAADQIAAFKGDKTPQNFVQMSLDLRKLAESSDQLDADKLRAYADQLKATGDADLAKVATYLGSIAADVDERAHRQALTDAAATAAEQGKLAAGGYAQAVKDELERRSGELPEVIKRFMALPDNVRASAANYIKAAIAGDTQGMIQEFNRLSGVFDPHTLDTITKAGDELRRQGIPKGREFQADDTTFTFTAEAVALAERTVQMQRAQDAGSSLTSTNDKLASSFDRVNTSASGSVDRVSDQVPSQVSELPEALKRYGKLSDEVKALTANFIRASLGGDKDQVVEEFNKVSAQLDEHTRDLVAAAGAELRTKGVPKGFIIDASLNLVPAIDALVESMPQLREAITSTFHGIESVAGENQIHVMEQFLAAFISGQRAAGLEAWNKLSQFMTEEGQRALFNLASSLRGSGQQAGQQVGRGLAQGADETQPIVKAAGQSLAEAIIRSVYASLGISSPSKVMGAAGANAALSFSDQFVRNARNSITSIQAVAREQGIAFRDAFAGTVQTEDGSFVPTAFFGGSPDAKAGRRGLDVTAQRVAGQVGQAPVQVSAPVTLGAIHVDGFNKDPQLLAREITQQVWSEFVNGVGRVWAQVEGAT